MSESTRTVWTCAECSNSLHIRPNSNYVSCHICGASFRLRWRGGQVVDHVSLKNIKNVLDDDATKEEVKVELTSSREELQRLNNRIRRIEMSKSGERFKVLSLFLLVCAAIYVLFRLTVHGVRSVEAVTMADLYVLAAAALAFLVFIINGIFKSATVRKVNTLIEQRKELEKNVLDNEASLHILRAADDEELSTEIPKEKEAEPERSTEKAVTVEERFGAKKLTSEDDELQPPTEETTDNIIKNFADRKKLKRNRLSLRDEEE